MQGARSEDLKSLTWEV